MSNNDLARSSHGTNLDGPTQSVLPVRVDPILTRVCCGQPVEPRLAEIRSGSCPSYFAAVWRCPRCGRATF